MLVRALPETSVRLGFHFLCSVQYFVSKHFVQPADDIALIKISYELLI